MMLCRHALVTHIQKLLLCPFETKIPVLPAQTAILLTRPISWILIKWQQARFALVFHMEIIS